jgi:hypothetical protein
MWANILLADKANTEFLPLILVKLILLFAFVKAKRREKDKHRLHGTERPENCGTHRFLSIAPEKSAVCEVTQNSDGIEELPIHE